MGTDCITCLGGMYCQGTGNAEPSGQCSITCILLRVYYYTPRKLCLWEGILFSRCPKVRPTDRPCVRNVLFP